MILTDKIVEIDVYKAKYNRGRMLTRNQVWVYGMIERGSNKAAMHIVKAHLQQQYDHGVVNDKADFVDPSTLRIHTHSIESPFAPGVTIILDGSHSVHENVFHVPGGQAKVVGPVGSGVLFEVDSQLNDAAAAVTVSEVAMEPKAYTE
ncbi:hypothetical protein PRIPAC_80770 [Pristionchus pacificus]|uniref:Uncharacterized protein n=1 Tax=Pristionchus pacificus TaxID=54126 RepID=A0A2A6BH72_PRIPA|nr:hypothetical protein PRIPAC_80770 [Pristionchus pacificus]|eukprot:PDM65203.1 hypothetical protein PRIPAC_52145 [Pristionchus pacificus]